MGRNLHHLKRDLAKLLHSWKLLWDLPRESSTTKPSTRAWPKKKVRNAWKAPNWLCYDYEDEILTFSSMCHKKLEMLKLHKGFLRIKNPVARNCELSDWKINIRRRNYFQIGVFLITKSFWRGITNRCVVNKISHQHVLLFFSYFHCCYWTPTKNW